jgi:hypothetical protein
MSTQKQNTGMAIASLVLGILSLICLGILAGIPAIICGHVAHNRARKLPGQYGGAGLAIGGFILGYLSFVVTLVIAAILLPGLTKAKNRAQDIMCVTNLKQVGLAFHMWASDHNDHFPFNVASQQGGTLEACAPDSKGFDANAVAHLQVLSNELYTVKILICPADASKTPALDLPSLQAANVSYWIRSGTNISGKLPNEVLARCPVHGNILTCDGSVQKGQ